MVTDLRPSILVGDVPLTECEVSGGTRRQPGTTYAGFDPERRRVTIWVHPDVAIGCPHCGVDGEPPEDVMQRAAYGQPWERLPKLENTTLPEPPRWDCGCRHPGSLGGDCDGSCQCPPPGYAEPPAYPEPVPELFRLPWETEPVPFKLPWEK